MITFDQNFDAEEASASKTFEVGRGDEMEDRNKSSSHEAAPANQKKTLHFQG